VRDNVSETAAALNLRVACKTCDLARIARTVAPPFGNACSIGTARRKVMEAAGRTGRERLGGKMRNDVLTALVLQPAGTRVASVWACGEGGFDRECDAAAWVAQCLCLHALRRAEVDRDGPCLAKAIV